MDPQFNKAPDFNLPQPNLDVQSLPQAATEFPVVPSPEIQSGLQGPGPLAGAVTPAAQSSNPLPQVRPLSPHPLTSSDDPSSQQAVPTNEEELDRLYVQKAKKVIAQTHDDPYMQSQEIGKVKADYLKTRHGKELKVAEGQP